MFFIYNNIKLLLCWHQWFCKISSFYKKIKDHWISVPPAILLDCEFTRSHVDRSIKHSSPSCHGVRQIVNYDWIMVRIEMENGEHSGALAQINFREGCSMNLQDCDRDVVNNTRRVIFWEMSPFESYKKLAWGLRRTFSTIINSPRIEMIVKTLFQRPYAT